MTKEEKIEVINKSNKVKLAERMRISRQGLYNKIKNKRDIDEIYEYLTNNQDQLIEQLKIKNDNLQDELEKTKEKYQGIILNLQSEISKLKEQNEELRKNTSIELKHQYKQLKQRYEIISDELIMYYIKYGKEGLNGKNRVHNKGSK